MPVRLKCKECGRKYYTAKSLKQVEESDRECQECGGELDILEGFPGNGENSSDDKVIF